MVSYISGDGMSGFTQGENPEDRSFWDHRPHPSLTDTDTTIIVSVEQETLVKLEQDPESSNACTASQDIPLVKAEPEE